MLTHSGGASVSTMSKSGLSNKVIQALGGWESPDMVSHYAQSLTFDDALKLYKVVNTVA